MTDFLKEIWGRFEDKTTRNLTNTEIDNIPRPDTRLDERHKSMLETAHEAASVPMPEGVEEPAQAAFEALRQRLTSYDNKGRPQKPDGADYTPPVPKTDQLMRDLKETEKRTARRDMDYLAHSYKYQGGEQKRKRKKFLGIF